jgi:hypothetical protein
MMTSNNQNIQKSTAATTIPPREAARLLADARAAGRVSVPDVWFRGRISDIRPRSDSGRHHFALIDQETTLQCVVFASNAAGFPANLPAGTDVRVRATIKPCEKKGGVRLEVFQVTRVEDPAYPSMKRPPLPVAPDTIGIITHPRGAALDDVTAIIGGNAPWTQLLLVPAAMSVADSPRLIIEAVQTLENQCDLILAVVGGGQEKRFAAFDSDEVCDAIARCGTPVVVAVGHAGDRVRAESVAAATYHTPSVAAMSVTEYAKADLNRLKELEHRLHVEQRETVEDATPTEPDPSPGAVGPVIPVDTVQSAIRPVPHTAAAVHRAPGLATVLRSSLDLAAGHLRSLGAPELDATGRAARIADARAHLWIASAITQLPSRPAERIPVRDG